MNMEVRPVLFFAAIIVFTVFAITHVKKHVSVFRLESLDAPAREFSAEPPEQTDSNAWANQQKQQRNQVLQVLEQDRRRQAQAADAKLMEAIAKQTESEVAAACPDDSDMEQCS